MTIHCYDVTIRGFANQAGTAPMPQSQGAKLAAAYVTTAMNELVSRDPGRQVGTVARLNVTPNAPNVVPGTVRLSAELRDLGAGKISKLAEDIRSRAAKIASRTRTQIEIRPSARHAASLALPEVRETIEKGRAQSSIWHSAACRAARKRRR